MLCADMDKSDRKPEDDGSSEQWRLQEASLCWIIQKQEECKKLNVDIVKLDITTLKKIADMSHQTLAFQS